MNLPPAIQSLIDQGIAYLDMDGDVMLQPFFRAMGMSMPGIQINNITINNNYYGDTQYGDQYTDNQVEHLALGDNVHTKY